MGKIKNNQSGFSAIEALLILVIVVIVGGTALYIYHSNKSATKTYDALNQNTITSSTKLHTPDDAAYFTQKTYTDYLAAVKNVGTNSQPGLVGLAAVKDKLTAEFYAKASASKNGDAFSCDGNIIPERYQSTVPSYTISTATVAVTIFNGPIGSDLNKVILVTVDLASLKITDVNCS